MVLHVKDEETDWLVRDFARRRGIGITEAIKVAVEEASRGEVDDVVAVKQRLEPMWAKVRQKRTLDRSQTMRVIDQMWED